MLKELFGLLILESGKLLTLLAYGAEGRDALLAQGKKLSGVTVFLYIFFALWIFGALCTAFLLFEGGRLHEWLFGCGGFVALNLGFLLWLRHARKVGKRAIQEQKAQKNRKGQAFLGE